MDKYIEDLDYDIKRGEMITESIHPMMPPMGRFHIPQNPYMPYMNGMPIMPSVEHMDMDEIRYMEHMNEYMTAMYHAEACRMRALRCLKK
ncbi:MAG: hypothetical protein N4A57_05770 [Anaeromicrobium sp.]|jgi:hypothetical protein|uniref:hypothetical protein n=1 Tax=Anaeromicrobium sp. TaxID=1929132 RepID=UPI0025F90C0A|nr:hypothetical protein [Anaeromicrobium sp.]MCT4593760.1 hypothetical protein [Anaeromicrobium sp.]